MGRNDIEMKGNGMKQDDMKWQETRTNELC